MGGGGGEDSGAPLIFVNNGKETRIRDEEKMKTIKWNFNQPRKEHIELLKDQLQPCVSSTIFTQLFHDDFKKHIAALDTLTKVGVCMCYTEWVSTLCRAVYRAHAQLYSIAQIVILMWSEVAS